MDYGQQTVHAWSREGYLGSIKMSTIVHSRGVGGQNWVKLGPRQGRNQGFFFGKQSQWIGIICSSWLR